MTPEKQSNASKRQAFNKFATKNFLAGIFWALGVTIGFSLLIAILSLISHYINFIPFVGTFTSGIIDFFLSYNKSLR